MGDDVAFSPYERLQYERAVAVGRDVSVPVEVSFFFSLPSPGTWPEAAVAALSELGLTDISTDEEVDGDNLWHVAASSPLLSRRFGAWTR